MRRPLCVAALFVTAAILLFLNCKKEGNGNPPGSGWQQESQPGSGWQQERQAALDESGWMQAEGIVTEITGKESRYGTVYTEVVLDRRIRCTLEESQPLPELGERAVLMGRIRASGQATNPGQFDFEQWNRSKGIWLQLEQCRVEAVGEDIRKAENGSLIGSGGLGEIWLRMGSLLNAEMDGPRQWAAKTLEQCLGQENGAVMKAMVVGDKTQIPEETEGLYRQNGISHILSISGLHLMLLGMGLVKVLKKTGLPMGIIVPMASAIMILYCIFVGGTVSALRATIMFCVQAAAPLFRRSYDSLSALGLAAILQLILNPYVLWDTGFQLSFLAVVGVSGLTPRLKQIFSTKNKWIESLLVSLGVTLTTLPILLYHNGTYAWHSIILNLLVVPVMAVLLWLALLLLLLCALFSPAFILCQGIGILIGGILYYYELVCVVAESLPVWETYVGRPHPVGIVVYVVGVLFFLFGKHGQSGKICILGLLVCVRLLALRPETGLEITMLDVGQGDGIVIRSAGGRVYLSDCGSSSVTDVGMYRLIPFLRTKGYGKIEGIFISHLDQDHYSGIMELMEAADTEHVKIRRLFLPISIKGHPGTEEAAKLEEVLSAAEAGGIDVVYLKAGDQLSEGELHLTCLHPSTGEQYESNNGSLVLALDYGNFSMLLTGDVEAEGEVEVCRQLEAGKKGEPMERTFDVLKVAHHGSSGSSTEAFLEAVAPKLSLISCGEGNSYGHPHEETLERLRGVGSQILTTADRGAITIEVSGRGEVSVYCWKESAESH